MAKTSSRAAVLRRGVNTRLFLPTVHRHFYEQRFGHTQTYVPTHTPRPPFGRATFSLCSSHSGCSVERLAALQRLSRTFQREAAGRQAGRTVAGKQAQQQTTPARNNSNRKKGLTSVIISPAVLSGFVNTRTLEYVSAERRSAESQLENNTAVR